MAGVLVAVGISSALFGVAHTEQGVIGAWNADDLASQIVAAQLAEALQETDAP